jgi:hypothetical protein
MENVLFDKITQTYDVLMPNSQETLLLLVALQDKVDRGIIEDPFSQQQFEETVDEVSAFLKREHQIQKEVISKKLSQYYYTTLKRGNEYRYQLTVFARDLVRMLIEEVQPEFHEYELVHTFRRTLNLTAEDLQNDRNFEYWYTHHFQPAKRIVLAHTENLQRMVDVRIIDLRQILKANIENTKDLVTGFIRIFGELGKQTEGLTQTLTYKQDILDRIEKAENHFLKDKPAWERYLRIRSEIEKFFENIDSRVLSINDRIQISSSRLKTLYDTLRYKQLFKVRIEKFLVHLLKESSLDDEKRMVLPAGLEKKPVPYFNKKYLEIPKLNFADVIPRDTPDWDVDEEFKKMIELKNMKLLLREESIAKWLDSVDEQLKSGAEIKFEEWFTNIFQKEQNLEVPIEVCFGLIHKHNSSKTTRLVIDRRNALNPSEDLTLWKLNVQPLHS